MKTAMFCPGIFEFLLVVALVGDILEQKCFQYPRSVYWKTILLLIPADIENMFYN